MSLAYARSTVPFLSVGGTDSLATNMARSGVVLSIGAFTTLAGYSGEPEPRWELPTRFVHTVGLVQKSVSYKKVISMLFDSKKSHVSKDIISSFLEEIFMRYLLINPTQARVFILENIYTPFKLKETLAELLFGRFKTAVVHFVPLQPMALVPLSKHSSLIVDIGYSATTIIPIISGCVITSGLRHLSKHGSSIIHHKLSELLRSYPSRLPQNYIYEEGIDSDPDATDIPADYRLDSEILDDLMQQMCFLEVVSETNPSPQYVPYIDKNGLMYRVSKQVRTSAVEIMFKRYDEDIPSLQELILESIADSPIDVRAELAQNILLLGGISRLSGLQSRIYKELNDQVKTETFTSLALFTNKWHFLISKSFYQPHLFWIGASVESALDSKLNSTSITLTEYKDKSKPLPDWTNLTSISHIH